MVSKLKDVAILKASCQLKVKFLDLQLLNKCMSSNFSSIFLPFHKDVAIAVTYNRDGSYSMQVSLTAFVVQFRAKPHLSPTESHLFSLCFLLPINYYDYS